MVDSFAPLVITGFFSGEVSCCRESDFMIAAWKRLTKGV